MLRSRNGNGIFRGQDSPLSIVAFDRALCVNTQESQFATVRDEQHMDRDKDQDKRVGSGGTGVLGS